MNNKPYSSQSILNSIYDPETQSLRITRDMPNGDYAPKEHTHVIGDVINLQNELDSKAEVDHNHDEQYLSLSGGRMTGTLHADSPVFTGDISEGGVLLSEKYAAKEHSHNEKADKASTLAGYGIMDAYTKSETDAKISSVYRYRGSVETYADLPTEGQKEGDVWNIASADAAHGINAGDNVAWTADGEWDALSGQVDLTPFALKEEAATDHNHDEQYLKLTGGTVTGTVYATYVNAVDSLSEGGVKLSDKYAVAEHNHDGKYLPLADGLVNGKYYAVPISPVFSVGLQIDGSVTMVSKTSRIYGNSGYIRIDSKILENGVYLEDKYAAKSHTHEVADVTGLQAALDAKADADAVPASAVTYAETLPTASENAPGCVIVTGATSETQTRGHVYALANVEHSLATSLNVSFENDVYSADTFRVYGSGSNYGSGGTLYEFDLAWISNTSASGTNVGQLILFKRKGSDTRWYLMGTSTGEYWGCEDNRCLDIDDPTELSGMVFRNLDEGSATNISVGSTMSLSITDAGTGGSVIDFTYGNTVVPMYQVADYNGKPKWIGKSTEGGMATQSLYFDGAPGWRYRNTSDHSPVNMTWNGQVDNLIGTSGMEWSDSEHGMGYAVTVTEKQLPSVTSYSYNDITVTELESLRASLSALEARVAALEAK